jgi:hypothetical protein
LATTANPSPAAWDYLPFYAGLPAKANSVTLFINGSDVYATVSGDDGYTTIDLGLSSSAS